MACRAELEIMENKLSHIDGSGTMHMVDISGKAITQRKAIAQAVVKLAPATLAMLLERNLPKGDALSCARIGGILAAKKTADLIPLCHTLPLSQLNINFEVKDGDLRIVAEAICTAQTGVEMEAIIAAQTAAAIIYDMCKAVQRDIVIADVRLLFKTGGKSGEFRAEGYSLVVEQPL